MVHIPENMRDVIFKPNFFERNSATVIENEKLDLDSILDKIRNNGIDS
jgi:hypothetical protein